MKSRKKRGRVKIEVQTRITLDECHALDCLADLTGRSRASYLRELIRTHIDSSESREALRRLAPPVDKPYACTSCCR